jgi:hypothetical protein
MAGSGKGPHGKRRTNPGAFRFFAGPVPASIHLISFNCSYWQCNIDRTYYSASPSTRCSAVMQTYNGMLYNCPAIAQCNINLYGCQ